MTSESIEEATVGKVRWRRFAILLIPATIVAGLILNGLATGAIAASFTISGQQFKVSANHLHGAGFKQFGDANTAPGGKTVPVATSVITNATLTNLCQSVVMNTPFGRIVLRLEAGQDANNPVTANNLVIGLSDLRGDAVFNNVTIGADAGELGGARGSFGLSSGSIDIDGVRQTAYSTTAGTFSLKGLHLQVLTGDAAKECF